MLWDSDYEQPIAPAKLSYSLGHGAKSLVTNAGLDRENVTTRSRNQLSPPSGGRKLSVLGVICDVFSQKTFQLNPSSLQNSQFIRNAGKEEKKKKPQRV